MHSLQPSAGLARAWRFWQIGWRDLAIALLVGVLVAAASGLVLARPWSTVVAVGQRDSPYLDGFHRREYSAYYDALFRWSAPAAAIHVGGAGPLAPLTLRLHGESPEQTIQINSGQGWSEVTLRPGWQRVSLLPRADAWRGDVQVQLQAQARPDPADVRERGVVLGGMQIVGLAGEAVPAQMLWAGLSAALLTLLCSRLTNDHRWGMLAALLLGTVWLALLLLEGGSWRLLLMPYTARLTLVLLLALLLALLLSSLLRWLVGRGVVTMRPNVQRWLLMVLVAVFVLRLAGMFYPANPPTDVRFHVGRAWMVREGKFWELFWPNPGLTPLQWDSDVTIPRSPFYYVLTVPATYVPGADGPDLASMTFGSITDTLAVLLVALLVYRAGGGSRAAVCAALLAGVLPFGLRVSLSWGIFPTLLAQCLALLVLLLWLYWREQLHRWQVQVWLSVALAVAFLAYPTALLFFGSTWAVLVLWLAVRRDAAVLPTLNIGAVATAAALLIYYGWHLPSLLQQTLPVVFGAMGGSGELTAKMPSSADGLLALWQPLWQLYGLPLLLLAGGGAALVAIRLHCHRAMLWITAWCAAYVPFALASTAVPLIEKHTVYILPMLALLAGLLLGELGQRRAGRVVVWLLLALVVWQAGEMWLDIVVHGRR
ncbi:MAG: hypothetical protein HC837_09535 [Chloroflexaceae bacterium]|nr:hypothetical protein [Chloroflexaceae bacterium]